VGDDRPWRQCQRMKWTHSLQRVKIHAKITKKRSKQASSQGDKLFRLSLENIADEIKNLYLSGHRGMYERLLGFFIGSSPFNAKHNSFYSGAFDGNDCFRLMENHALIFEMLRKAVADEENNSQRRSE
jgi:hypothetical protein